MKIVFLEAIHYPPQAPWIPVGTNQPTWEEIESAIRRLDRDEWPMVNLHTQLPGDIRSSNNMLTVRGGNREYQIYLVRDGLLIHFENSTFGDEMVQVMECKQIQFTAKRSLCNDLYHVLKLVRFFVQTGELSPDASWGRP